VYNYEKLPNEPIVQKSQNLVAQQEILKKRTIRTLKMNLNRHVLGVLFAFSETAPSQLYWSFTTAI
jgi:hypothetical protein